VSSSRAGDVADRGAAATRWQRFREFKIDGAVRSWVYDCAGRGFYLHGKHATHSPNELLQHLFGCQRCREQLLIAVRVSGAPWF